MADDTTTKYVFAVYPHFHREPPTIVIRTSDSVEHAADDVCYYMTNPSNTAELVLGETVELMTDEMVVELIEMDGLDEAVWLDDELDQ